MFVSGNLTVSGNLFLGNTSGDNISVPGVFTTNLVPGTNGTLNLGTEGAKWNTIYANSVTASISGSVNNVNITALSESVNSQLVSVYQTTASLNLFSASVTSSLEKIYESTASLNNFSASVTASLEKLYESTASLNLFSASVTASLEKLYESTASLNDFTASITGAINKLGYFDTEKSLKSYSNSFITSKTLSLGTSATSFFPERLMVDNSGENSFNIATFQTSMQDSYAQINIKNFGSGSSSSTDLILWNDVSTESSSYIDLGINSSNYSAGNVGYGGDGYLYNAANDLYIGSTTTGSHGHLHLFGGNQWKSASITVYGDGKIGVNTDKLNNSATTIPTSGFEVEISGGVKFDNDIHIVGNISSSIIASLQSSTASLNLFSASVTASLEKLYESTASLNTFSSSTLSRLSNLETTSGSHNGRLSNLESKSASVDISLVEINSYTSSLKTAFEFTGSNVTILGDLNVRGTQTIVDSTTVQIGDNILELNGTGTTNGGIHVKDATSPNNATGSLIWDTTTDYWIAGVKGIETKVLVAGGDNVFTSSLQLTEINSTTASLNLFSASVTASLEKIYESTASLNQTTASLNLFSASVTASLEKLYESTASLNSFSASVTASLEKIYESTASLNLYTQSVNTDLGNIHQSTASLNLFSASVTASLEKIYESTASLNLFSASVTASLVSIYQTTASLNLFSASVTSSLEKIYESTSSLNLFSASVTSSLEKLYESTASLNLFSASVTASLEKIYESTSSLNLFSASVTASLEKIYQTTSSLNVATESLQLFSSSALLRLLSLETETGSLEGRFTTLAQVTGSIHQFTSSLNTYTGATEIRLDDLEYTASISIGAGLAASFTVINQFTASTNTRLNGLELYSASYAQYFTYSGSEFHIDFNV
jgi:ABC-type transporter Mla subunit MlaD